MSTQIVLEFYKCEGYINKADVLDFIKIISENQINLAEPKFTENEMGTLSLLPFSGNLTDYVDQVYTEVDMIDGNNIPVLKRRGPGRAHVNGFIENPHTGNSTKILFALDMYGRNFNRIVGVTSAPGTYQEYFAQTLLNLAHHLYLRFQPRFGFVDFNSFSGTLFNDVLAIRTKKIYWANFFDPKYVEKYGKEYLLNAPAWKKELLPDNGVFLQLNEQLTTSGTHITLDMVKKYFSTAGIKFVSWPNNK
jgi:hypothetical protein